METLPVPATISWQGAIPGTLQLLDQTLLPQQEVFLQCSTAQQVWQAIKRLAVRGAPAIGVSAAYGLVLGLQGGTYANQQELRQKALSVGQYLKSSRPTAVNLAWAMDRMLSWLSQRVAEENPSQTLLSLLQEAKAIHREDEMMCLKMGEYGAALLPDPAKLITHCNTGSLATAGQGTALSVIFAAAKQGKHLQVYVDETRPLLQGARLTCWELQRAGIPATLQCDSAAATLLAQESIQAVLVGADRIAANGDVANKIGTYMLAVLCQRHSVPFYVVAPYSTFDFSLTSGKLIPIEQRAAQEVATFGDIQTAPAGIEVFNPAFDITPAELITAIVTERGVIHQPSRDKIRHLFL